MRIYKFQVTYEVEAHNEDDARAAAVTAIAESDWRHDIKHAVVTVSEITNLRDHLRNHEEHGNDRISPEDWDEFIETATDNVIEAQHDDEHAQEELDHSHD